MNKIMEHFPWSGSLLDGPVLEEALIHAGRIVSQTGEPMPPTGASEG
ncbi:hypothetical protein [Mesorhizobium sp.]|nr:hypothetical protein [Mesorhizobium sp.]